MASGCHISTARPTSMSSKAALLTLITSLFLMISNGTQAQSAGEQPSLHGYTGQALGKTLAETLKLRSLGVATNTSSTCASFASAIGSAAFAPGPQRKALSLGHARPMKTPSSLPTWQPRATCTRQAGMPFMSRSGFIRSTCAMASKLSPERLAASRRPEPRRHLSNTFSWVAPSNSHEAIAADHARRLARS